jgi:hypothetical protein
MLLNCAHLFMSWVYTAICVGKRDPFLNTTFCISPHQFQISSVSLLFYCKCANRFAVIYILAFSCVKSFLYPYYCLLLCPMLSRCYLSALESSVYGYFL